MNTALAGRSSRDFARLKVSAETPAIASSPAPANATVPGSASMTSDRSSSAPPLISSRVLPTPRSIASPTSWPTDSAPAPFSCCFSAMSGPPRAPREYGDALDVGSAEFSTDANIGWDPAKPATERWSIKSRWQEDGAGRSDALLTGGGLVLLPICVAGLAGLPEPGKLPSGPE